MTSVKQWVLKHKIATIVFVLFFYVIGAVALDDAKEKASTTEPISPATSETTTEDTAKPAATSAPTQVKQIDNPATTAKTEEKNTTPEPVQSEQKPPTPSETVSQKNAVKSAKSYLNFSAFSRDGLVAQLEYEKFSHADAVYGTDNSGANWNEQAAKSAKQYMEYSSFSRGSLIEQLKFGKFTQEQAEYGANAVGL